MIQTVMISGKKKNVYVNMEMSGDVDMKKKLRLIEKTDFNGRDGTN